MVGPSTTSERSFAFYFNRTTSNELEDSSDLSELAGQPTTKKACTATTSAAHHGVSRFNESWMKDFI